MYSGESFHSLKNALIHHSIIFFYTKLHSLCETLHIMSYSPTSLRKSAFLAAILPQTALQPVEGSASLLDEAAKC